MANSWDDLDTDGWDGFTTSNWDLLTDMSETHFFPFGGGFIKTSEGPRRSLIFAQITGGISSDEKVVIGGVPFSTSKVGEYHVLDVIEDSGYSDEGEEVCINGNFFKLLKKNGHNIIDVQDGSGDGIPDSYIVFKGIPLTINADSELIVNRVLKTIDEYSTFMWGGEPLRIARSGHKWFLIVPA